MMDISNAVSTMVNNIVVGVTKGYEEKLEITGVGYRAAVQGKNLQLALGYSHDVIFPIPDGIQIVTPKPTEVVVTGMDKQKVGQVAAACGEPSVVVEAVIERLRDDALLEG